VKQAADVHSGLIEQRILDSMLRSGRLTEHLKSIRATYGLKARTMIETLHSAAAEQLSFSEPAGGMFVWAQLQGTARHLARADWFSFGRAHRVLVYRASVCGRCPPQRVHPPHLRQSRRRRHSRGIKRLVAGLKAEGARRVPPAPG